MPVSSVYLVLNNKKGLILDKISGLVMAYAMTRLLSNYNGPCISVKRTSDNTVMDIGFIGNNIDITTLLNFCGGSDAVVTKRWDQTGNENHAIATNGPRIVIGGILVTDNEGNPGLRFDGTNYMAITNNNNTLDMTTEVSIISRITPMSASSGWPVCRNTSGAIDTQYGLNYDGSTKQIQPYLEGGSKASTGSNTVLVNNITTIAMTLDGVRVMSYINGNRMANVAFSPTLTQRQYIYNGCRSGVGGVPAVPFNGIENLLLLFNKGLTSYEVSSLRDIYK